MPDGTDSQDDPYEAVRKIRKESDELNEIGKRIEEQGLLNGPPGVLELPDMLGTHMKTNQEIYESVIKPVQGMGEMATLHNDIVASEIADMVTPHNDAIASEIGRTTNLYSDIIASEVEEIVDMQNRLLSNQITDMFSMLDLVSPLSITNDTISTLEEANTQSYTEEEIYGTGSTTATEDSQVPEPKSNIMSLSPDLILSGESIEYSHVSLGMAREIERVIESAEAQMLCRRVFIFLKTADEYLSTSEVFILISTISGAVSFYTGDGHYQLIAVTHAIWLFLHKFYFDSE